MAAPKKDETPKHIKEFKDLSDKVDQILNTHDIEHSRAYVMAADKHLKGKDGTYDTNLLDNEKIQDQFIDTMVDHYVTAANNYFGTKLKKDDKLKTDMLLKAYGVASRDTLSRMVKKQGSDYTVNYHDRNDTRTRMKQTLQQELSASASAHLTRDHAADVVKYTGAGNFIDHTKMTREDVLALASIYDQNKAMSEDLFKKAYGKDHTFYKKAT